MSCDPYQTSIRNFGKAVPNRPQLVKPCEHQATRTDERQRIFARPVETSWNRPGLQAYDLRTVHIVDTYCADCGAWLGDTRHAER